MRNAKIMKAGDSFRYWELKCQNTSPKESQNHEMRNAKILKAIDSFIYWVFGYGELGMSRTLTAGVLESRNVKRQNPEIGTPTKNVADRKITPFQGPGYW
jgi:hypothetical protein